MTTAHSLPQHSADKLRRRAQVSPSDRRLLTALFATWLGFSLAVPVSCASSAATLAVRCASFCGRNSSSTSRSNRTCSGAASGSATDGDRATRAGALATTGRRKSARVPSGPGAHRVGPPLGIEMIKVSSTACLGLRVYAGAC